MGRNHATKRREELNDVSRDLNLQGLALSPLSGSAIGAWGRQLFRRAARAGQLGGADGRVARCDLGNSERNRDRDRDRGSNSEGDSDSDSDSDRDCDSDSDRDRGRDRHTLPRPAEQGDRLVGQVLFY